MWLAVAIMTTAASPSRILPRWLRRGNGSTSSEANGTELRPILGEDEGEGEESEKNSSEGSRQTRLWERFRRLLVVCLLVLVIFFAASAYSVPDPFFPIEVSEKGGSPITTGVIFGVSPLCLVVLSPVVGYYLPRLGVKFTLISGILLVGSAFLLFGFLADMPSGAVFVVFGIVASLTEGVGSAMGRITAVALLPYLYPSHVGLLTGLVLGFEGLGYTIGPPIGSLLVSVSDYRVPFWTMGGVILMLIALAFLVMKPTESLSTEVLPFQRVLRMLSHLRFSMLLLTNVAAYSSLTFMDVTLALYLTEIGLNQIQIGIVFGIVAGAYALFSFPFGKLSDMFGTRKFPICGILAETTSLIIMGLTPYIPLPQQWTVVSALILLGCSLSLIDVPVYSELLDQAHALYPTTEEDKDAITTTVSGVASFSISVGEFLGSILGGFLTHLTDFPAAVLLFGEAVAVNAVLVLGVTLIDYFHKDT